MDDQGTNPQSAPPATADRGEQGQPLPQWQIPQPAAPQAPYGTSGAEPPAQLPYGSSPSMPSGNPPYPPAAPSGPSYPAYPPSPYPTPTYLGAPSTPLAPGGAPPAYPMYPSYPAYPGSPSMPLSGNEPGVTGPGTLPPGASYPETAATPYYPIAAAPYPYPYAPSFPAATTIPQTRERWLARPFPIWLSALIAVGSIALLVAAFFVGSMVEGQDWAGSAAIAGVVAGALAVGALALFVVRVALGRRAGSAIALGVVGTVLLVAVGLGGLAGAAPIHALQASSLEAGGSWNAAIHEYALSGERAPNAPEIARIYDEWGESLLHQGTFASAVDRFNTVINTYASSGATVVNRANLGLLHTYGAWVEASTSDVPYATAIQFFVSFAASSACDDTCHTQANAFEAQGRFQYGQQLASQGLYQGAIAQFEAVQSEFPTSAYASQAHTAAATSYLSLGKQQIVGANCATDAVATYQTLAKRYSDTPEGKQAQAALRAPVTVTGHISGPYPRNPTPTAVLSTHIDPNNFYYSSEYTTGVDAGSGSFTFHNVRQGNYNFSTVTYLPSVIQYVYWFGSNNNYYFVQVGPLCTVSVDTLQPYPTF